MGRGKVDAVYREVLSAVRRGYATGERFMTVREVARRFGISIQTAHTIVRRLGEDGVLEIRPRSGATVAARPERRPPWRIGVVFGREPQWLYDLFVNGLREGFGDNADPEVIAVEGEGDLWPPGLERILAMGLDGVIGIACWKGEAFLPLYFLQKSGVAVLSDLPWTGWRDMPRTCVDFRQNSVEAGKLLRERGHRSAAFLTTSGFPEKIDGFKEGFGGKVTVITEIWEPVAYGRVEAMLQGRNRPTAAYIPENNALPNILPIFDRHRVRIPDDMSVVMHDGIREPYSGWDLPVLASVSRSLTESGKALALRMNETLLHPDREQPAVQTLPPVVQVGGSVRDLTGR